MTTPDQIVDERQRLVARLRDLARSEGWVSSLDIEVLRPSADLIERDGKRLEEQTKMLNLPAFMEAAEKYLPDHKLKAAERRIATLEGLLQRFRFARPAGTTDPIWDELHNALASPSEGNKKGEPDWHRFNDNGDVTYTRKSRPQEQSRDKEWARNLRLGGWTSIDMLAASINAALAISVFAAAAEGWQVITEIAAERQRQRTVEGWTDEHDDGHRNGSLASAAAAYALRGADRGLAAVDAWPASWDRKWFKPKDRRRDLIRAGALIVAEIERRDRAAAPPSPAAQEPEK